MSAADQNIAFQRGADPFLRLLTREQIEALVAYRGEEELRRRIEELADKSTEGVLLPVERDEYEGYVRANNFVSTLQTQARRLLSKP